MSSSRGRVQSMCGIFTIYKLSIPGSSPTSSSTTKVPSSLASLSNKRMGGADVAHPDDMHVPRDGGTDNSWVVRVGHEGDDKVVYGGVGEEGGA